jgi:hypothetical protein
MAQGFDGEQFGKEIVALIKDYVSREVGKLRTDLELRFKVLEKSKGTACQGVYENGRQHVREQFCTYSGSLWHCNATTRQSPGDQATGSLPSKKDATRDESKH